MREDINTQEYRDFGDNLGKYTPGTQNIAVNKNDGSLAGLLNFPMPDFSVSDSLGISTLISPSYLTGVRHNGGYKNVVFGNKDVKYSTVYRLIARNNSPVHDFHVPRLNKVVTETAAIAFATKEELKDTSRYTWYTRVGSGTQYKVDAETQALTKLAGAYSWRTGGTLPSPRFNANYLSWTTYAPDNPLVMPLDGGGQAGDSGSPVLVYDNLEKVWKLASVTVSISGHYPYGLNTNSYYIQDDFIQQIIAGYSDPDITDISEEGQLNWGKTQITQGKTSWAWHGVSTAIPGGATNEELDASKDLRFNGEGGALVLDQAVNLGAGKLRFSGDYQVKSAEGAQSTWVGGGIEVDSGKRVLWQVNGLAGDALHKIGAGTLHVNATGINQGSLNTGDGTVILDQQADVDGNKQAFSSVTLVSARPTVVLKDANQVATENIFFGYRGGTLDLNGNDLSFKAINHTDSGATLVNHNSTKAASLTLTGNEHNPSGQFNQQVFRGFLGSSESKTQGVLNVNVDAAGSSALVALTGGMNISDFHVKQGTVLLSGQPVPHAAGVIIDDDWATALFSAGKITVGKASRLQVGEYARVKADIVADENSYVVLGYNSREAKAERLWRCYSVINTDTTSCNKPVRSAVEENTLPASTVSGDITLGDNASLVMGKVFYQGTINTSGTSSITLDSGAFWQIKSDSRVGASKALSGSHISLLAGEGEAWTPKLFTLGSLEANELTLSLAASPATEQSDKVVIKDSATGSNNILDISVLTEASEEVKLLTDLVLLDAPGGTAHDYFTVPTIARGFSLFTPNYQVIEEQGRVRWVLAHNAEPDPIPDPEPEVGPVPDPAPDVGPVPDPDPAPDVDPIPDVDPTPNPDPAPDVDPIPDVDPTPNPDPAPDVDPIPDVDPTPNPDPAPDVDPIPDVDPVPDPAPDTETPVTPSEPSGWFTVGDNQPLIRGTRALLASRQYLISEAIAQMQGRASLLRVAPEKSGEWATIEHTKGSFQGVEIAQQALNLGWDKVVEEQRFGLSAGFAQGTTKGHGKGTHHLTSMGVDYGWSSPQGWFADAASRYMYLSQDLSFDPLTGIHHGKVNSHILAASIKSGYQFKADQASLFISPYVGLSGGYLPGYGLEGDYARVDLSSSTPYYATVGLEVKKRGLWESNPSLIVSAGVEYQYSPGSAGSSVTLSDSQSSRTFSAWSDNRLRVQAGLEGEITDNLSMDVKAATSVGGNFRTDYSGIAGINYHF
ncbi:S6 family peptidase [Erwinia sp. E_sp_B04_7]